MSHGRGHRMRARTVPFLIAASLVLASALNLVEGRAAPSSEVQLKGATGLGGLRDPVDPPAVRSYPSSAAHVQRWIDDLDRVRIRAHGWDIWESITSASGQGDLPVWETWYSGQEVFGPFPSPRPSFRVFERAHQVRHSGALSHIPVDQAEQVLAFNRYTSSLANYIRDQGYNQVERLAAINEQFDQQGTPIGERKISTSTGEVDPRSIALKPVFQFISGGGPTAVPYWAGVSPQTTTNLDNPTPSTWRQCVVVDPSGELPVGSAVSMPCNNEPAAEQRVVPLEDFYFVVITEEEAAQFSQFAAESGDDLGAGNQTDPQSIREMVQAGNTALLVAMHATTKEISNWTWQTFWWAHNPADPTYGRDRPATIGKPWSHYNLDTAYYMVTPPDAPKGDPLIAFNPYLETNLAGSVTSPSTSAQIAWTGVHTNCMTCHRMAAWSQRQDSQGSYVTPPYWPDGLISADDSALFGGFTKVDFLWSIAIRAQ
jgi:hypothetical protein